MEQERLLIFGGTFNPIHLGHIRLYRHFARRLSVDRVLLIPSRIPPHKQAPELARGADRLAMCRLAAADDPRVLVSDLELRQNRVSYTWETLAQIQEEYPGAQLYLAVGSDMLLTLDEWRRADLVMKSAVICALARKDGEYRLLLQKARELEQRYGGCFLIDPVEAIDISSTQLRQMVKEGGDLSPYLPAAVEDYIKRNGIYQNHEV